MWQRNTSNLCLARVHRARPEVTDNGKLPLKISKYYNERYNLFFCFITDINKCGTFIHNNVHSFTVVYIISVQKLRSV